MSIHPYKLAVAFLLWGLTASAQSNITEPLSVDATDAPRNILHATVTIPVTPGPVTIVYPKWIPGTTGLLVRSRILPAFISKPAARNWNGSATWKTCMPSTCRFQRV
jgi:hypothetical protein